MITQSFNVNQNVKLDITVWQIYRDQTLPFQQLKNQYGLSHPAFLTYAQLAPVISKKCKEGAKPASCPEVD